MVYHDKNEKKAQNLEEMIYHDKNEKQNMPISRQTSTFHHYNIVQPAAPKWKHNQANYTQR